MKIIKIALVAVVACGMITQAGVQEKFFDGFALYKPVIGQWITKGGNLFKNYGALGISGALLGAATHGVFCYENNHKITPLNKKFNCAILEACLTGVIGLCAPIAKKLPGVGSYLNNNFAYYAIGALALNRIWGSVTLAPWRGQEAQKIINDSYALLSDINDELHEGCRIALECSRMKDFCKTFVGITCAAQLYRLSSWVAHKYMFKK